MGQIHGISDYTKSGHYTVKSDYWVQSNVLKADSSRDQVLQPSLDPLYQTIWKLETSPKIRHFFYNCFKILVRKSSPVKINTK